MSEPRLLKTMGAILLLLSLCLPMSTCVSLDRLATPDAAPNAVQTRTESIYAVSVSVSSTWPMLLVFAWPAGAILLARRLGPRRLRLLIWWLEPILISGTAYLIYNISNIGDPAVGAGVAGSGLLLYSTGWCWEAASKRHRTAPA